MTTAEVLKQVGQKLQAQLGDAPIPGAELTRQAALVGGYQESSVIPSDFCYNRTNAGIQCPNHPMFVQEGRGQYRFVGFCYPYTGVMFHKPHGQPERVVGSWHEGDFTPSESDWLCGSRETTMQRQTQEIIADLDAFRPEDFEEDWLGEGYSHLHTVCAELMETPHADQAADSLFALFERLEGRDLGLPGPVVHTLETLADYQSKLVLAVQRKPTTYTVWMLNRVLNAPLPSNRREFFLSLLQATLSHPLASTATKADADRFIKYQQFRAV